MLVGEAWRIAGVGERSRGRGVLVLEINGLLFSGGRQLYNSFFLAIFFSSGFCVFF